MCVQVKTGEEDDDDIEYCLVVNSKKSGTSTVVGTPEIAPRRSESKIICAGS